MNIQINIDIKAPIEKVWEAWTSANDIVQWNFASVDWCCPKAKINLSVDGKFNYRMQAKDGSMGFDFEGTFTKIETNKIIEYEIEDKRTVQLIFTKSINGVTLTEIFEAEDENTGEQQKQGWKNILNNFKNYVENK